MHMIIMNSPECVNYVINIIDCVINLINGIKNENYVINWSHISLCQGEIGGQQPVVTQERCE